MSKRKKWLRLSPTTKDNLWQVGKNLICLFQFYAIGMVVAGAIRSRDILADGIPAWLYAILCLAIYIGLYIALWRYYDNIDDRSFNAFCAACRPAAPPDDDPMRYFEDMDGRNPDASPAADKTPVLLEDRAWRVGFAVAVIGVAPVLAIPIALLMLQIFPSFPPLLALVLGLVSGAGIAFGLSLWHIRDLNYVWSVQKDLRRPTDKVPKLPVRIIYAVIYFVSIAVVAALAIGVLSILLMLVEFVKLFGWRLIPVAVCLLAWWVIQKTRRFCQRQGFIRRLRRLAKDGEITYKLHGHPYLSLFFARAPFGLTLTDLQVTRKERDAAVSSWNRRESTEEMATERTYQVAVANCLRRRYTVVLAEGHVFRFMYSFRIRAIGAVGFARADIMTIPMGTWFKSYTFEFPEGEGERILLVDPAPTRLCMHGHSEGELIPLDNASKVYDYTVYGRLAFLRLVERT